MPKKLPSSFVLLALITASHLANANDQLSWSVDGSYRLRYESLDNSYRANSAGGDQILASRLLTKITANIKQLSGAIELQDSRAWLDDSGTPLGTDDINTLEPIQAWLSWNQSESFKLKIGRQTLDIGSRRLMARQRFRNTIRSFDGVHLSGEHQQWRWQSFYFKPVMMRPDDRQSLDRNANMIDKQSDDHFWGVHLRHQADTMLELYYFKSTKTNSDLHINTVGFRNAKKASPHHWDYEIETIYQFGDRQNLDVSAGLVHAHIGYQFKDPLSSRLELTADYVSGDDDPNDRKYNRFDTLYGVTRFDFGPTSIYGTFARSNLQSPGLKWKFKPRKQDTAFVAYRAIWLDSVTDSQARSRLRDRSGESGRFVGHQLEARWRYNFEPKWRLELGGAYLMKGKFFKQAPDAPSSSNTAYWYTQMVHYF
jgi:hypothetical protein